MTVALDEVSELKNLLSPLLDECTFEEVEYGQSDARVIRVLFPDRNTAYLKYASGSSAQEILQEHQRTRWLRTRARTGSDLICLDFNCHHPVDKSIDWPQCR